MRTYPREGTGRCVAPHRRFNAGIRSRAVSVTGDEDRLVVIGTPALTVMVPRIPGMRDFERAKAIAVAAARSEGIAQEPEVREANDWPDYYSPTKDPQGWVFSWTEQP